jgi:hypothetical protein
MQISPKAIWATISPIIAAVAVWLITGEEEWLIGALAGLVSGGAAVWAPPAPRVTQAEVANLSEDKRNHFGPRRT